MLSNASFSHLVKFEALNFFEVIDLLDFSSRNGAREILLVAYLSRICLKKLAPSTGPELGVVTA